MSGNGSSDSPYRISAEPVIDITTGDNILTCGPDGLYVPGVPPEVAVDSCLTITGTGTVGDPYTFTTTAFQDDLAVFSKNDVLTAPYTGVGRFRFPFAATIVGVSAAVNTAPTGDDIILDVNKNGATIFSVSTKPTIAATTFDTGGSEYVPDDTAILSGDYLTVDIDQVGSVIAGSELTVFVHYTRPITCPVEL